MRANATNTLTPRAMFQTGVILSATTARGHDLPRTVRIGQEERVFEALAFNAPWLDLALEGPLTPWTLQLAHADEGTRLPILLGLEEDPFSDGLTHLPDVICPVADVALRTKALVAGIKTAPLHAFVRNVFQRRDVLDTFWIMPASGRDHHSYPGGLAVHSQEVADDLSVHLGLSDLELDLGIAGALLHDIGKVWSYTDDMFPNAASLAMSWWACAGSNRNSPAWSGLGRTVPTSCAACSAAIPGCGRTAPIRVRCSNASRPATSAAASGTGRRVDRGDPRVPYGRHALGTIVLLPNPKPEDQRRSPGDPIREPLALQAHSRGMHALQAHFAPSPPACTHRWLGPRHRDRRARRSQPIRLGAAGARQGIHPHPPRRPASASRRHAPPRLEHASALALPIPSRCTELRRVYGPAAAPEEVSSENKSPRKYP